MMVLGSSMAVGVVDTWADLPLPPVAGIAEGATAGYQSFLRRQKYPHKYKLEKRGRGAYLAGPYLFQHFRLRSSPDVPA